MDRIANAFMKIKSGYDWVIAQIGIHPGITFWCVVAYLVIRQ